MAAGKPTAIFVLTLNPYIRFIKYSLQVAVDGIVLKE